MLFALEADSSENCFCSRSRAFVHGIVFSSHCTHSGNSLRSHLSPSLHQRKPRYSPHSPTKFRCGPRLRHESARSFESGPQRIYLHRAGDFLCASSGPGERKSGVWEKSGDLGGRRIIKKKKEKV